MGCVRLVVIALACLFFGCVFDETAPEVAQEFLVFSPGQGPGVSCSLPPKDCTSGSASCGKMIYLDPRFTVHYDDYPINGETASNQYRSYMRRELAMLLNYATAKTQCKTKSWTTGIGGALGMGDASEKNGAIPGTSIGSPGHPAGTHVNGRDIDIAYYQLASVDNHLRPICPHTEGGADKYHCTQPPNKLDAWRTALFIGSLLESNRVRVIGVDGKVGPIIEDKLQELCDLGWLTAGACAADKLAYEVENEGAGWYHHHHHHLHVSLKKDSATRSLAPGEMECLVDGCGNETY